MTDGSTVLPQTRNVSSTRPQPIAESHGVSDPVAADGSETRSRIFEENRWREPDGKAARRASPEIEVSRWVVAQDALCDETSTTPIDRHVVSLALIPSRLTLSTAAGCLFEGSMSPGTMHISVPGQQLRARFTPPFDFLHFHVANRFLCDEGFIQDETSAVENGGSPLFRDPLVEALGRSLIDPGEHCRPQYVESVCKAIVMRALARQQSERQPRALPKWRLRRLERHLAANIDKHISLEDMAAAAGLSKMHFAAQFRAATGFRPHEYLLLKRVEQAKITMSSSTMPLVEVAFSVGFNAQAHFSTVFKRFTGRSPARWKQEHQCPK
jgi:AraC family transcriptional regulator